VSCTLGGGGLSLCVCAFVYSESRTLTSRFSALIPARESCVADSSVIRNKRKISFLLLSVELYVNVRNMARCHAITLFTLFGFLFLTLRCRKLGEMGESLLFVHLVFVAWQRGFIFLSREWRIYTVNSCRVLVCRIITLQWLYGSFLKALS
jgi:hypothetical protein